jgi:hypothetical protein
MAIHAQDRFSKALGISIVSDRIESFAWIFASQYDITLLQFHPENRHALRNQLANHLEKNEPHSDALRYKIQQNYTPNEYISWITDRPRQSNWIFNQIGILNNQYSQNWHLLTQSPSIILPKPSHPTPVPINTPIHLKNKNLSIALFDYWTYTINFNLEIAIAIARLLNKLWEQQEKIDQLFEWINENNADEKLRFFWEWLNEREPTKVIGLHKFQSHDELLTHFDSFMYTDSEKILLSRSARTAWNQRIRRENNKDKKQCNYIFSKSTVTALDKLAQKYHLTRTNIIEILVESESKHETYIKERLTRINSIKQPLN